MIRVVWLSAAFNIFKISFGLCWPIGTGGKIIYQCTLGAWTASTTSLPDFMPEDISCLL